MALFSVNISLFSRALLDMKVVVLYSGGLDSCVMLHMAKNDPKVTEVIPVYFDIGHEYAWKEKQQLPEDCHVHDMTWFKAEGKGKDGNAMGSIFIPGRNMMFATIAACNMFQIRSGWVFAVVKTMDKQLTRMRFSEKSKMIF